MQYCDKVFLEGEAQKHDFNAPDSQLKRAISLPLPAPAPDLLAAGEAKRGCGWWWWFVLFAFAFAFASTHLAGVWTSHCSIVRMDSAIGNAIIVQSIVRQLADGGKSVRLVLPPVCDRVYLTYIL